MIRQRIRLRTPTLAYLVRLLTITVAVALFWYGLMILLLALKVAPHTVNQLSAYRTLYHDADGLKTSDFTTTRRLIIGFAGLLTFLICLYLALQELPRPYLARGAVTIDARDHGDTEVQPRAIERAAEIAACRHPAVSSATGRLGDEAIELSLHVRHVRGLDHTLLDIYERIRVALQESGLPALAINVTLTGHDPQTTRELS